MSLRRGYVIAFASVLVVGLAVSGCGRNGSPDRPSAPDVSATGGHEAPQGATKAQSIQGNMNDDSDLKDPGVPDRHLPIDILL